LRSCQGASPDVRVFDALPFVSTVLILISPIGFPASFLRSNADRRKFLIASGEDEDFWRGCVLPV